jgi:quinol monooxygenase YgiN
MRPVHDAYAPPSCNLGDLSVVGTPGSDDSFVAVLDLQRRTTMRIARLFIALVTFPCLGSAGLPACSSSSSSGGTVPPNTDAAAADVAVSDSPVATSDGGAPVPAAAFFRGTLAKTVAESKAFSDPFFMAVEAQATAAGDTGHDALLGTTNLGTTLNQFVGLDTWSSDTNMDAVYSDPHVQSFAASFYAAPPEFKTFYLTNFYQWGDTDSGDTATPHYMVVIRGRFRDTPDKIKPIHDPIAQGAQAQLKAAGAVAHIVYSGRQDPQEALMIEIWTSNTNIDSFYSNQELKSAVGSLFDATGPNLGVYGSTDWVTW